MKVRILALVRGKTYAYTVLAKQTIAVIIVATIVLIFASVHAGYSVFIGGLVCILPNVYFASRVFRHEGARAARKILSSFYIGEAVKLLLTALFFGVALVVLKIQPLALFGGYLVAWFSLLMAEIVTK